jgi:hypothetical protein
MKAPFGVPMSQGLGVQERARPAADFEIAGVHQDLGQGRKTQQIQQALFIHGFIARDFDQAWLKNKSKELSKTKILNSYAHITQFNGCGTALSQSCVVISCA